MHHGDWPNLQFYQYRHQGSRYWAVNLEYGLAGAPLLRLLDIGGNNQKKLRLRGWPSTKVEWFEDTNNPVSGTLDEALDDNETEWMYRKAKGVSAPG